MKRFHEIVSELELTLGPDTSELELRVGLHSGPITAGVLRGDRARFQLFGDTMNSKYTKHNRLVLCEGRSIQQLIM